MIDLIAWEIYKIHQIIINTNGWGNENVEVPIKLPINPKVQAID